MSRYDAPVFYLCLVYLLILKRMRKIMLVIALFVLSHIQMSAQVGFNGASFGQKVQEREQKKKEELKALEDLIVQLKAVLPQMVVAELRVEDPVEISKSQFVSMIRLGLGRQSPDYYLNDRYGRLEASIKSYAKDFTTYTQKVGNVTKHPYVKNGEAIEKQMLDWMNHAGDCFLMTLDISVYVSESDDAKIGEMFDKTLDSIIMSDEEIEAYKKSNTPYTDCLILHEACTNKSWSGLPLRNSPEVLEEVFNRIKLAGYEALSNFVIKDNLGGISSFNGYGIMEQLVKSNTNSDIANPTKNKDVEGKLLLSKKDSGLLTNGVGLFSPAVLLEEYPYLCFTNESYRKRKVLKYTNYGKGWVIHFLIPKSEISKYKSFSLEKKK